MNKSDVTSDSQPQLLHLLDYLQTSYNIKFNDDSKEIEANLFFLDAVKDLISGLDESDLAKTVDDERIQNKIRTRRNSHYLFQLPIVFLIYYLLRVKKNDFRSVWPYTPDDLVPFLVDCGISQRD